MAGWVFPAAAAALVASALACVLALVAAAPAGAAFVRPFEGSFGSFENVQAVAVDQASGDVFVYDNGGFGGDVYKFDAAGNPVKYTGGSEEKSAIDGVGSVGYPGVQELAVSQAGETKGDLYAVNGSTVGIYSSATGEKLGELSPGAACGVAVDASGDVYVGTEAGVVDRYAPKGKVVEAGDLTGAISGLPGGQSCQVGVDGAGNTYVLLYSSGMVTRYPVSEYNTAGEPPKSSTVVVPEEAGTGGAQEANTLAVDPANGNVYLDRQAEVKVFDPTGKPVLTFADTGEEPIATSRGIAVVPENGKAYVADDSRNRVDIFAAAANIAEPAVTIEPATNVESGEPVFHGTVNPEGHDTKWKFEYSLDAGKTWLTTPEQDAGTGSSSVPVEANAGDLHGEKIEVRLHARNDGGPTTSSIVELETPAVKCPNEQIREEQHSTYLPDCRAYEQVSPPEKGGVDVMPSSMYTRASVDGEAASFASLAAFGAAEGAGIVTEYLAQRDARAGDWMTHPITPPMPAHRINQALLGSTLFEGEFSSDFARGVLTSGVPLTDRSDLELHYANLYLRDGLRTSVPSAPTPVSACPLCQTENTQLPAGKGVANEPEIDFTPFFVGASPNLDHIVFESGATLTSEAPPQLSGCGPLEEANPLPCSERLYESENGVVRLVGVLPDGQPADSSFVGKGQAGRTSYFYPPEHLISDGSDGHSRIFFTQQTNAEGKTVSELGPLGPAQFELEAENNQNRTGNLFMRVDHAHTFQLNECERSTPCEAAEFAPARFLGASSDGTRAFFTTRQPLTDGALPGRQHIYLYETSALEHHHLSLIVSDDAASERDNEIAGVGVSANGGYLYFSRGSNVAVWHDGQTHIIEKNANVAQSNDSDGHLSYSHEPHESRVTRDGKYLVFASRNATGLPSYTVGKNCPQTCRQLFVYSAATGVSVCISCPSGAPATAESVDVSDASEEASRGGAHPTIYENRVISSDGRFVFFSTPQSLVPRDTNGVSDAYVFDMLTHQAHLLSSGRDPSPSFVLNTGADGRDAFIATRQALTATDGDAAYDVYDVRVDGGFPEVQPGNAPCSGLDCRTPPAPPPTALAPASASLSGLGNIEPPTAGNRASKVSPRAARLRAALRACRRKRRLARHRCERSARKRHSPRGSATRRTK